MLQARVIPCLLLRGDGLVKTVKFTDAKYVGDPINAVRIFNTKEVDELVFLDISATRDRRPPDLDLLARIASEAFMPLGYGGGITTLDEAQRILGIGVEKVILNTAAVADLSLVAAIAARVGSQSVVVSIDARRTRDLRYRVYTHGGTVDPGMDPVTLARMAESAGAGEILLTSIDNDGTQGGYDLDLVRHVSGAVSVPVVACGGAGSLDDLRQAVQAGASAVAAGSLFVFRGRHRAVLITYPEYAVLESLFAD